jgi:hypothetical protein
LELKGISSQFLKNWTSTLKESDHSKLGEPSKFITVDSLKSGKILKLIQFTCSMRGDKKWALLFLDTQSSRHWGGTRVERLRLYYSDRI